MAARKLDKSHGFMKQIVKNQIDRNEYDKEMREKTIKKTSKQTIKPVCDSKKPVSDSKKPVRSFYEPPNASRTKGDEDVKYPVYKLEFIDKRGIVHETVVNKTDDGFGVARRIGSETELPEDLIQILARRINEELVKHTTAPR